MECTQRLECTQELYGTQSEKLCPEQIGFLGICGTKYPVKKGPNKIGRDPATCSIVLNLNSVSRQHAVINILNKKDFMLMDLDSANKTKLMGQSLQPYIPKPLKNGDTVQFGEIFGVFRLLEEEDELPMTQALDIPDTPIPSKHMSRINTVTTVPESPDVSDKDDSFIVPSQPKGAYQSPKTRNLIKPGKTISILPIGTNKIDNIYWNSSKKSTSLNLDDSNASLDDSLFGMAISNKENKLSNNIHELENLIPSGQKTLDDRTDAIYTANTELPEEAGPSIFTANTQLPTGDIYAANTQMPDIGDVGSIHTANTQMPNGMSSPSIHTMNTQMPCGGSPSIHTLNTQLPPGFDSPSIHDVDTQFPKENLPDVCKINEQEDMQFDLCANKHDDSMFNAETQVHKAKDNIPVNTSNKSVVPPSPSSVISNKLNTSDEELFFDDVDQPFDEVQESQAIFTEDIDLPVNKVVEPEPEFDILSQIPVSKSVKRNMRIGSDSSADCEDIEMLATQKLTGDKVGDDDTTDCEDEDNMIELKIDKIAIKKDVDKVLRNKDSFERVGTSRENNDIDFEDMPTQVLNEVDTIEKDAITKKGNQDINIDFEDLPTQVLQEDIPIEKPSLLTKKLMTEVEKSPFKIPSNSAFKAKRVSKTPKVKPMKYYEDTQQIIDDLCTQKIESLEDSDVPKNDKVCDKMILDTSVDEDPKDATDDYVNNLTSKEVLEVIGVDKHVAPVIKVPSDASTASDLENTPKKLRHFNFNAVLPDSQEIKTGVSLSSRTVHTESSSESDTEHNSEEQNTPVVFRKKIKLKPEIKLDLASKFDVEALPSRIITRVRKPTEKLQNAQNKKTVEGILKPKFLTEQEEMDASTIDVIKCNISKLKAEKNKKSNQSHNEIKQSDEDVGIAENVKRVRNTKNKSEDVVEVKLETKTENKKEDLKVDTKIKERRQRKPRNAKKQTDSKKQSSLSNKSTNQSYSIVETNESINITNKSKEINKLDSTKATTELKRIRSTRNARTTKTEEKSAKTESDQVEKPKRKYTRRSANANKADETVKSSKSDRRKEDPVIATKTKKEEPTKSPEQEVRRSRRQRTLREDVKSATDQQQHKPKSILKNVSKVLDESRVYNMSSSSADISRTFKRPTLDDSEAPSPKRTRSVVANSGRITPSVTVKTQYVLFTAFPFDQVKTKLENLGAILVTDLLKSTVVLTKQIKRTFKLLCAVGLGKPIVGPSWVQACIDNNMIVDPWQYLIKDEEAEKRFHFSLERTLTGRRNFLKGYNVSSTPKVMPDANEMKLIVEYSGGTWREGGSQWVCVSVPADCALWPALRARGATVVSTEFILGGVLRQRVDVEANTFKIR